MKRIVIALLAVVVLLLVACTPSQPTIQPTEMTTTETTTIDITATQATTTTTLTTATPGPTHVYEIQLYRSRDYGGGIGFYTVPAMTDGTAEHIFSLLWPGGELLHWEIRGNTGHLDLNADLYRRTGSSFEYAFRATLGNTFLTFFELDYIIFTSHGQGFDFGHFCWGCGDDACGGDDWHCIFTYFPGWN
ncbi:MAG: hypothetical protein FWD06_09890 [Oscillospiraceae bacterium]|nr:hypothetical protein [Oscillospiraceae bacterium]